MNQESSNLINTTVVRLKAHLQRATKLADMYNKCLLTGHNFVCFYAETYLTIELNENKKPFISGNFFPQQFSKTNSIILCRALVNGHNQSPVYATAREYYNGLVEWLTAQIENTKALLN